MAEILPLLPGFQPYHAHGSRDMPVWGRAYRILDGEYYFDTEYDSNALVRARILSLLEYISKMQFR